MEVIEWQSIDVWFLLLCLGLPAYVTIVLVILQFIKKREREKEHQQGFQVIKEHKDDRTTHTR